MKKIYNLPGLVKKAFLLTLLTSVMMISYGQTVNQKPYDENQGSSVATPNLTENMSLIHRFKLIFEVGYQYQSELFFENIKRIKFNVVANHQFNPYISYGGGIGMRYYHEADLFMFPLFYDMRVRLLDKPLSPYFSIGIGYTLLTDKGAIPVGLYFDPEFGVSYKIKENLNLHFTIGYDIQNLVSSKVDYIEYNPFFPIVHTSPTIYSFGAFSATFGVTF